MGGGERGRSLAWAGLRLGGFYSWSLDLGGWVGPGPAFPCMIHYPFYDEAKKTRKQKGVIFSLFSSFFPREKQEVVNIILIIYLLVMNDHRPPNQVTLFKRQDEKFTIMHSLPKTKKPTPPPPPPATFLSFQKSPFKSSAASPPTVPATCAISPPYVDAANTAPAMPIPPAALAIRILEGVSSLKGESRFGGSVCCCCSSEEEEEEAAGAEASSWLPSSS